MRWLSEQTGISTSVLSDYKSGTKPGADKVTLIADALKVDLNWLLTGNASLSAASDGTRDRRLVYGWSDNDAEPQPAERSDTVEVAEIDLRYGLGATYLTDVVEAQTRQFSRAWLRHFTDSPPDELFWAKGQGNSMEATIHESDIVLIDRRQQTPRMADLIWAFAFGEIGMIKRLRPMPDGSVKILSDNPAVAAETAHDGELNIIGRVVAVVKRL